VALGTSTNNSIRYEENKENQTGPEQKSIPEAIGKHIEKLLTVPCCLAGEVIRSFHDWTHG
jgi:hypothetical protein